MNFEELKSRDIKDLRLLAAKYSIKTHHKQKPQTIAKLIVEHITAKPGQAMQHPAEKLKEPAPINTEAQIRDACAAIFDRPGFTAQFDEQNWWFKCRGAEECGHMSVPLRVIRSKADAVSRGAISPRGLKDNPLNPTANSGIVLMV